MARWRGEIAQQSRLWCLAWLTVPVALVVVACSGATDAEQGAEPGTTESGWATNSAGEILEGITADGRIDCSAFRTCGDFPCDQGAGCHSLGDCGEVCAVGMECDFLCMNSECLYSDSLPPTLICGSGVRESFGESLPAPETETSLQQYEALQQAARSAVGDASCELASDCELASVGSGFCRTTDSFVAYATATVTDEFLDAVAAAVAYDERLRREADELLTCEISNDQWNYAGAAEVSCSTAGQCEVAWAVGG